MPRVITSISYDLKYDVRVTAPGITVVFTDKADDGHESHGRVTITDAEAAALVPSGLLDAVNAVLDAKAAAVPDLPTLAARMTEADELDRKLRAKRAQVEEIDAQLASKAAELDAEPTLLGVKS